MKKSDGYEVIYAFPSFGDLDYSYKSLKLGRYIADEVMKIYPYSNEYVYLDGERQSLVVKTNSPAVVFEYGFMTNKENANLLITHKYRKDCAQATLKVF